jgi:hypothetical protein
LARQVLLAVHYMADAVTPSFVLAMAVAQMLSLGQ